MHKIMVKQNGRTETMFEHDSEYKIDVLWHTWMDYAAAQDWQIEDKADGRKLLKRGRERMEAWVVMDYDGAKQ